MYFFSLKKKNLFYYAHLNEVYFSILLKNLFGSQKICIFSNYKKISDVLDK
jgi:hypothetical protein